MYNIYDSLVEGVMFCYVLDCSEKKKKKEKKITGNVYFISIPC